MSRRQRWLLLAILLLAFGLRAFRLDGQSLWYDEGVSVALAGRSLGTITRSAAADIHPPFYYYLLHPWTTLAGSSPTAVRFLSAVVGTLLAALTWALGRQLFSPTVALAAATLAAVSPFQVYYSQETRMYVFVAALGALSTWLAIRCWRLEIGDVRPGEGGDVRPRGSRVLWWGSYVLVSALVLYTHYFGFSVLLAQNLAVGSWVLLGWKHRLGLALRWAAAQVAVIVLYLPWLAFTWSQLRAWPAVSEPFALITLIRNVLRVFSLGSSVEPEITATVWAFSLLLILGLASTLIRDAHHVSRFTVYAPRLTPRLPAALTIVYVAVPIVTLYALSLRRPLYNPKFLLLATPPFHLLVALGIAQASRLTGRISRFTPHLPGLTTVALLGALLPGTLDSLHNYYFDPHFARDDYRGIVRTVAARTEPGDAVLLNAPGQIEIFNYYYGGSLPRYPLPRERPPEPENLRSELQDILERHDRIYGVFWATDESDPQAIVEGWLNDHAYKAMDAWYGNVRLVLYDVPPAADEGTREPIDARLGERIRLRSLTLPSREVAAGDVLPLTLRWQATAPIEARYKVFVQLLSPTSQLIAQRDAEPGGGTRLTTTWEPSETVVDRYGVFVPPGTPPADYRLIAGMYGRQTGQRLSVKRGGQSAGDFVDLGTVRVVAPETPPPIEALDLSRRIERDYGAVQLLGYTLDKRGAEGQQDVSFYPGDTLRVTLFWQARSAPGADLALTLSLVGGGETLAKIAVTPTDGLYPAPRWSPGQVLRDPHDVPLPPDLPPGRYEVRLAVAGADGSDLGSPLRVPITVQDR